MGWARTRWSDAVTSGCHYATEQRQRLTIWRPPLARVLVGRLEIIISTYGLLTMQGFAK